MYAIYSAVAFVTIANTVTEAGRFRFIKPQSHRACDIAATKQIDNRREVAEVAARFYKGRSKIGDRSPYKISRRQSFWHARKTSRV